ncbi:hypothetical protein SAMN04488505_104411 [Chitinophaga rupis]|uniref:Uncharacterized protein n=1 Tax=Chitinophaga rupis TaxID=573321 RepID=A0A1H7YD09_9BACT|nr:hypothetical protein SAMN04488505_104411 [Chitinophaga rupis]
MEAHMTPNRCFISLMHFTFCLFVVPVSFFNFYFFTFYFTRSTSILLSKN